MPMRTVLAPLLVIFAFWLFPCLACAAPAPETAGFTSLAFGQAHMNYHECYSFELRWSQAEKAWLVDASFARSQGPREGERVELEKAPVSDALVGDVTEILKAHHVRSWRTSKRVQLFQALDETTWRASIVFADGKNLEVGSALIVHGGDAGELHNTLLDCFVQHLDGGKTPPSQDNAQQAVSAMWARDVPFEAQDSFVASPNEPNIDIVFVSRERVARFGILALVLKDVGDDGKPVFAATTLHSQPTLEPEHPLLVTMQLIGSIPNNGIAYEDASGVTRAFAVEESGEDGSLLLTPITIVP